MTKPMGERLMAVETKLQDVCEDIQEIKTTNTTEHSEIKQMIKDFIDGADGKYAPRVAWDIVKIALGVVITASVGLVVYLIERHII
jgi:uncharacterized membrane-anchored protein YjiN (DUF445 family)